MRWELMDRYLAGESGGAERAEVERWLAASRRRRQVVDQLAGPGEVEARDAGAAIWARLESEVSSAGD